MNKEEIISYVMETPGNTNPNVLRSLLDSDGGDLPPITSEDNGKVIKIKSGEYGLNVPIEFKNPELDSLQNDEMALIHGVNYNKTSSILIVAGDVQNKYEILSVPVLPDVGDNTDDFTILYLLDGEDGFEACINEPYNYLYSYVTEVMASSVGVPAGWYKTSVFIEQMFGSLPDAVLMTKNEAKNLETIDASKIYIIVDEFLVYNNTINNEYGYDIITDVVKTLKDNQDHFISIDAQLLKLWSALGCKVRLETYFVMNDETRDATLELSGFLDNTAIFSMNYFGILYFASLSNGYIYTNWTQANVFPQASNGDSYKVLKALYDDYNGITYSWVDCADVESVPFIVSHDTGDTYRCTIQSFTFDDCLNKYYWAGQLEFDITESGSNPQNPDLIASFYAYPNRSTSAGHEIISFSGRGFGIDKDGNLCYVSGGIYKNSLQGVFTIKRYSGLTKVSQ